MLFQQGGKSVTEYIDKNDGPNDSLVNSLNALEKRFLEKNKELINLIDKNSYNPFGGEKYRVQLVKEDSSSFAEAGKCLLKFGYPSAKIAGEASDIPFFIMSYASVEIKEKYFDIFQQAVNAGDLSRKTFAFFVDKLKLAKGEKQVYGTQRYYDKNKGNVYYSSIDPKNLNKRRAEMGLEALEPSVSPLEMIQQAMKIEGKD